MDLPERFYIFSVTQSDGSLRAECVTTAAEAGRCQRSTRHEYLGKYALVVEPDPTKEKKGRRKTVMT